MKLASTAADPEIRVITKAYTVAVLNHDAAALAALFTEDAIFVTDTGPVYDRKGDDWKIRMLAYNKTAAPPPA